MANQDLLEGELESFRQRWKEELSSDVVGRQSPVSPYTEKSQSPSWLNCANYAGIACTSAESESYAQQKLDVSSSVQNQGDENEEESDNIEEKAEKLYRKGVASERNGFVYEALIFYREAIHLVPDIESKITDFSVSSDEEEDDEYNLQATVDDRAPEISDVANQFQTLSFTGKHVCENEFGSRMTHISDIPVELLMYIFKWVVSTSLDFRSLEQLSMVCKGFYVCARDRELWRLGCTRLWGDNCDVTSDWNNSWRWMFISRPHVWTQGVYISKTSYVRQGEQLQELWSLHLVTYYRYIQFYNDGLVHVLTTPEEPQLIVPKLNQPGLSVMSGCYHVEGKKVIIELDVDSTIDSYIRGRRNKKYGNSKLLENKFQMELEIQSAGRRQRHNQLVWMYYCNSKTYRDSGQTVVSEFDLSSQFPPFFYSRVCSYTQKSTAPLQ